jgi:hypothetical protein
VCIVLPQHTKFHVFLTQLIPMTYTINAVISLNNLNPSVSREMKLLAVRQDMNFEILFGWGAIVKRLPLTADTRVRFCVSPCCICCGQRGTGIGFLATALVFPYQYNFANAQYSSSPNKISYQKNRRAKPGSLFWISGEHYT